MSINRRILLVDDDERTVSGYSKILRFHFNVTTATSGREALEIIKSSPEFGVIISDYRMPEMNGIEFLLKAKEINPHTVRIIFSGNADLRIAIEAVNEGNIFRFLTKPIDNDKLIKAIKDALEQFRLIKSEKRLLTELATVNSRINTLLSHSPVILFSFDSDGKLTMLEGKPLEGDSAHLKQNMGKHYEELFQDYEQIKKAIHDALEGKVVSASGHYDGIHYETTLTPVIDDKGNIDGIFGIATDITGKIEAESALEFTQKMSHTIINTAADAILTINKSGRVEFYNDKAQDIFGYKANEVIGKNVAMLMPESYSRNHDNWLDKYLQTGVRKIIGMKREITALRKSGDTFPAELSISEFETIDGKRFAGIVRDISDRKEYEEKIKRYSSRLESLIDNLGSGILVEDENRNISYVNKQFVELFGIPVEPSYLFGTNCENSAEESKHLFKYERDFVERINIILEDKEIVLGEVLKLKDGRYFERDFIPFQDGDDYYGHLWQYRDITERKQSEAALRIRERAIQSSTQGVVICDALADDMPVIFVNPAFEIITGYKRDEVLGRNLRLLHLHDREQEALDRVRDAIENRISTTQVLRNYKKDGTLFWNELSISPVFNERGVVTHFVGIENDISSRIKADNLLKESNKKLTEAYSILKQDLEAAAKMQRSLLPDMQKIGPCEFKWFFEPSVFLSGDIFNYFSIGARYVAFYIIDVAGHGIPSALMSVTLSRILTPEFFLNKNKPISIGNTPDEILLKSPCEIIENLNLRFCSLDDAMEYFTMILGFYDIQTRKLHYCQAGHPKLLILRDGDIEQYGSPSFPVAMFEEAEFDNKTIEIKPGDRMFIYSDGITECESPKGEFFGEENLIKYIDENKDQKQSEILGRISEKLYHWRKPKDFEDDITFISIDFD